MNEAQARWFIADKALDLGRGGVSWLSAQTGVSRTTITKGIAELEGKGKLLVEGRIRRVGAGRKSVEVTDPAIRGLITQVVSETTAGDPQSPLKWTAKATRTIAAELKRLGHLIDQVDVYS